MSLNKLVLKFALRRTINLINCMSKCKL